MKQRSNKHKPGELIRPIGYGYYLWDAHDYGIEHVQSRARRQFLKKEIGVVIAATNAVWKTTGGADVFTVLVLTSGGALGWISSDQVTK